MSILPVAVQRTAHDSGGGVLALAAHAVLQQQEAAGGWIPLLCRCMHQLAILASDREDMVLRCTMIGVRFERSRLGNAACNHSEPVK